MLHHLGQAGGAGRERVGFGLLLKLFGQLGAKTREIIPNKGVDECGIHDRVAESVVV